MKASSATAAIRKAKTMPPDDVYVSEEWKAGQQTHLAEAVGFHVDEPSDEVLDEYVWRGQLSLVEPL